jgi:hypothetical protein
MAAPGTLSSTDHCPKATARSQAPCPLTLLPPPPPLSQALDQLVRQQSVTCTFDSFSKAFPTSAPVLALSSSRSLLREAFTTVLPLQPAAGQQQQQQQQPELPPQQLELVRDFLLAAQVGPWACAVAACSVTDAWSIDRHSCPYTHTDVC